MKTHPHHNHLYEIAENQAGYFTNQQASSAGFSRERLSYYASTGRFIRVQPGVYRLAQFPGSPYEDLFVAWLRTGPNSIISHESALYLFGLSDALPGNVHVIMPRSGSRRRKDIRLHTNRVSLDEITHREGLPVTTVARTIVDVAASGLAEEQVRQAIREALQRGLTTKDELLTQTSHRGRKVTRIIQNILNGESE